VKRSDINTILWLGGGLIALRYLAPLLGAVDRVFEATGISESAAARSLDQMKQDPGSFWNGQFWRRIGPGAKLLRTADAQALWNDISSAVGYFNDDEQAVFAAFKKYIRYQSQLSYFAWWLGNNKGVDLLTWLEGGTFPADRLSAAEIDIITQYVKKLPRT
jgi:hypothetical protein